MLTDDERQAIHDVCETEPVRLAYLFGSHANEMSDVDIAVLADDNDIDTVLDLKNAFEQIIDEEVDVTLLNKTDPRLLNQVLQTGQLLYAEDEQTRIAFETSARSKYLDMKPHIDEYDKHVRKRLTA